MTEMIEITEQLHVERDALPASDVEDSLRAVQRVARRRRRQTSLVGVGAAGGLLVAGLGAVNLTGSGATEIVVTDTSPPVTTERETSVPPETSEAPETPTSTAPQSTVSTPPAPSLTEAVVGRSVDAGPEEVTTDFRTAAGDDFGAGWQVPWNGGFLVGGRTPSGAAKEAFFSADGRSWESIAFDPGIFGPANDGIVAADGRLVMLGSDTEPRSARPMVAHTTDLENWTVDEIPIVVPAADLSDVVEVFTEPRTISAHADGWMAIVETTVELDAIALAEQLTEGPVANVNRVSSDDGISMTVNFDPGGGAPEEIQLSWTDLEDKIGRELTEAVRERITIDVWTGTWDGEAPVQANDPSIFTDPANLGAIGRFQPMVAIDSGFVRAETTQEFVDEGPPVESTQLFEYVRGVGWTEFGAPISESESVMSAFPLDGDLGILAKAVDDTISIYRVDVDAQTWTPIDIPDMPETARYIELSRGSILGIDAAPEPPIDHGPFVRMIEKGGYRFTTTNYKFFASYELVSIETGEVIVAESIDLRDVEGSLETVFEHLTGSFSDRDVVVVDPETGVVLITVTAEERIAAYPYEPPVEPESEPWIVATDDGVSWFAQEVRSDDPAWDIYDQSALTVSGGRLLYRNDARQWFVVDLE